jgi:hypothetical protein
MTGHEIDAENKIAPYGKSGQVAAPDNKTDKCCL